jgi:phospholipid/cholesterol/gamma-HCH transport system permease protein
MVDPSGTSIKIEENETGTLKLTVAGRLDSTTTGQVWRRAMKALTKYTPKSVVVQASGIDYCDVSGIGFLKELERRQRRQGGTLHIEGMNQKFQQIFSLFDLEALEARKEPPAVENILEEIGRSAHHVRQDIPALIAFIGEILHALVKAAGRPGSVRWKDTFQIAERAGANALPIVALISFLIGLIMAFQSAIPMRQFGAEIFVADLVALSMVRELGPLMTAVILAGRSGSAFAAALGAMKVNEEIDALTTMGLDPVRFLVVPRIIAAVSMTPLLAVFADLLGIMGGSVVLISLGYPSVTYFNQVLGAVDYVDFTGGLIKSFAFGLIVAAVGCLRGLQTKTGPLAVGESTTRAVVSSIILIVAADGTFAVIYYFLGI